MLAVLATVAFMAQLDLFIVNVAVPAMDSSFHGAGLAGLSWVLNAYAIVFAALLVPAGRLADHFGRRRFLLTGIVFFTAASVLCAVAPNLGVLIAGRMAQAAGAALIVPTSLGLLLPTFPRARHTMVVGVWAGVGAVAASSAPPAGGLLIEFSWRWIFIINVPIGVAALIGGLLVLPEVRADEGARLPDPLSAMTLLAAVTLAVLATVQGPNWGWASTATITTLAVAALCAVITVQRAITHPRAIVEASLFRSREFTAAAIAMFLFYIAFASFLLITVLFLQDQWHYSPLRAGLALSPGPMSAAIFAVSSGRITACIGRSAQAFLGCLATAAAAVFWLFAATADPSYTADFLPGMILSGIGAGLTQAPLLAAAGTLPAERATTGSAVLTMSRQIGSAAGVAVLVALLGTGTPHALSLFHRGWAFDAAAAVTAAIATVAVRSHRKTA